MIVELLRKRPRAFACAIVGLAAGFAVGHTIGGVGVAMRGGAFRIDLYIILGLAGIAIGYWTGSKADRRKKEAPH